MGWEVIFVFALVAVAGIAMASGRVRMDVAAFLVVLALGLSGILGPMEALAGFSDPVVLTIASLLIVGEALARTGVASQIGNWITRFAGTSESRTLFLLMVASAILSSIMSSTAVVAIFIPVAVNISHSTGISRSRLLLPLAYAVIIGGMMTLLATAPNLVVSGALEKSGFDPFAFFSFTPIGAAVLLVAIVYVLWLGRKLFPGGEATGDSGSTVGIRELAQRYGIAGGLLRIEIQDRSRLVGSTLASSGLGSTFGVRVLGVERTERFVVRVIGAPSPNLVIRSGDVLIVQAHGAEFADGGAHGAGGRQHRRGDGGFTLSLRHGGGHRRVVGLCLADLVAGGTLVMEPGGYRYIDFVKAGVPLLLLTWGVTMAIIPLFFEF